jgi:AraC-like DNA-binding protein
MSTIAALLESKAAMTALRRSLPKGGPKVVSCRSADALHRTLEKRLIDAVVLAPQPGLLPELTTLRSRLPRVPLVVYGPFRPDDGELLLACRNSGSSVAVEGVDDSIVGELVIRSSITAERRRALADAPRVLRLTEQLQQAAWDLLVGEVEQPVRTSVLARRLRISREHLSRQFGAGGAPNLKRVIDLTRVACAAQLLANPGYSVPTVVRLLHFTSPSHLASTARRIANVPVSGLSSLGPRGVLAAFARGNTRSRG